MDSMNTARVERGDTAAQILDVAERLVQVRGFNGFSYADVAAELKITKAALHYHFAGKAELGEALVTRYAARFDEALAAVEARTAEAAARLDAYADLYLDVLRAHRMCLCGMMAAEYETLPLPMQNAVVRFFEENERWVARVLRTRASRRNPRVHGTARRDGPDDRERPGGSDARGPSIRRHSAVSRVRRSPALRSEDHTTESRRVPESVEGAAIVLRSSLKMHRTPQRNAAFVFLLALSDASCAAEQPTASEGGCWRGLVGGGDYRSGRWS